MLYITYVVVHTFVIVLITILGKSILISKHAGAFSHKYLYTCDK